MAKFNLPNTNKIFNRSGYPAYQMQLKEQLVTAALTSMFGEPKYYGSTDNDIVVLAQECAGTDPAFLCRLACYARKVGNMRSVSHVLTAVIARLAHEYTRRAVRGVVLRPDDITEIMACYAALYGKPFPNAMKREIAEGIQQFDEYQLAKYNGGSRGLKLRDVLRITHPKPGTPLMDGIFRRILVHEYGHTRQSLLLGPFYLPLIGLPSLIWNRLPYFRRQRKAHKKAYYAFFPERWANELGERYLREEAPGLWE